MDKNWLIRTKSNYILGPVSKEKVLELYKNGSIKQDDEVCSGNGYWFFIREEDLVNRFLLGSEIQGFNPISEAKSHLHNIAEPSIKDQPDDITLIGQKISLTNEILKKEETEDNIIPPEAEKKSDQEQDPDIITVNKNNNKSVSKKAESSSERKNKNRNKQKELKKQNWLYYSSIFVVILLFCLVYFRKTIIRRFMENELSNFELRIINSAEAEEILPEKKKLFEHSLNLEKIVFKPVIGLDGFKVATTFDIEDLTCGNLNSSLYQLGVILFPPELLNEKLLIKIRDCVVQLPENHPLKRWLKWVSGSPSITEAEQKKHDFLSGIIDSQFNLITDENIKNELIKIILEVPENSIPEKILKSYLHLMIGNISRSDNILKKIIQTTPKTSWENSGQGFYHKIALSNANQIIKKLSKHPTDRKIFHLTVLYFRHFMNDEQLITLLDDIDTSEVEAKLNLKYVERISTPFIHFLKIMKMSDSEKMKELRSSLYKHEEQSYWIWPFINIDPFVSNDVFIELRRIEKDDQLWFIFLMENEKLSDLYSKKSGKSLLPVRRPFLKKGLKDKTIFMMSLYKLIEMGDVGQEIVDQSLSQIIHE